MVSLERENRGHTNPIAGADLAVCILFYEKLEQTLECIQSFLPSAVNIYILNNGSSPSSRRTLGQFCANYKQIEIFDSDTNLGVGVGRNYLVTNTTEGWLLFVDSDIIINTSDWLQKFVHYVSRYPDTEVFIPRLFNRHENRYVLYRSMRTEGRKVIHDVEIIDDLTNVFPGGASFINRKLFNRLGLYDDKMFVGFEDFELCIRGIRLGNPVKARIISDIELVHNHRQTKKIQDNKAILTRYDIQLLEASFNRMAEKHNIILESNWKNWVSNQVKKVSKYDKIILKKDWRHWIFNKTKKILRQCKEIMVSFVSFFLPERIKMILKKSLHP